MKGLLIAAVVILGMVFLGWITFNRDGDRASVTVETDVIKRDAGVAAEKAEEVGRRAAAEGGRLADEARRTDVDVDVRRDERPDEP